MSSPTPPARVGREYGLAMLALAAGAALLLAAAGRHWATGRLDAPGPVAPAPVELTGTDLTGALSGIGWAGLAAIAGLYAARNQARRAVGLLVALGGAAALGAVWDATRPATLLAAVSEKAADAAGGAQAATAPQLSALGPAMAVTGAVLLVAAGLFAVVRAPVWPGMGTRYDRDAAPRATRAETPSDLWKSLDAGEDPTLDAPGGAASEGVAETTGGDTEHAPLAPRPAEPKEKP
ncbi:Trp biosynthesis protein [Nocardiopsis sp. TSRI0078]|uniref:Trp biosynthesis-associated membrane protein n=1 Tax=unclassified Nocardiopsis TaxID=2649073 RepID=UPI00093DB7BA|nr:Trp biosynthesis-associated membrane protein [Nocardiopsis sp. TSRI0078]OKI15847.1 Trp biosynthesis protein [Nocardiopsis sp. TSRI0078]